MPTPNGSRSNLYAAKDIVSVKVAERAPFPTPRARGSSARAAGLRYERKVIAEFLKRYKNNDARTVRPSVWFEYTTPGRTHFCQPDILVEGDGRVWVLEIKLRHTPRSWFQLFEIYEPVLRRFYPKGTGLCLCEVTSVYDCAEDGPKPLLVKDIEDLRPGVYGLHLCHV